MPGVLWYPAHLELLSTGAKCRTEVSFSAAGGASRNENSRTEVRSFHSAEAALRTDRAAANLKDQKGFRLTEQQDTSQTTQPPRHEGPNLVVVKGKKKSREEKKICGGQTSSTHRENLLKFQPHLNYLHGYWMDSAVGNQREPLFNHDGAKVIQKKHVEDIVFVMNSSGHI